MLLLRRASVWVLIAQVVALSALQSEEAIVYPEFLEERSDNGARTVKIKDDLTLSLVQKSPFPERLHLRTPQQDGSVLNTYVPSSPYSSKLFQDEDNFASLVVTNNNGFHFQGMIGDDLRIEPLLTAERSSEGRVAHRLYKVEEVRSDTPIYQYVSAPATSRAVRSVDNMIAPLYQIAEKGIGATGTLMKNRIPKGVKLSSELQLNAKGRGISEVREKPRCKNVLFAVRRAACPSEGGHHFGGLEVLKERLGNIPLPRARDRPEECSGREGVVAQGLEASGEGGTGRGERLAR
ncbi:uncharacterized protein LOC135367510 [Ornithodoros turicata]|uniref:uncharacterized protein LOC135367510 n=1 Tax=Ornithodoros turicata TaxID=34597 RepID=UPI00313A2C13